MIEEESIKNILLIGSVLFFSLMTIGGFLFSIILKYHFKKFNYKEDPRGNWLVKNYFTIFLGLVSLGIITILINLLYAS